MVLKSLYIRIFSVILILGLGIVAYSNTLHCSFHFDDNPSIIDNPAIKNIHDVQAIWAFLPRRFVLYLSIALNYHFNQLNVVGYHVFNLAVHLISALLVWWLTLLTFSTPVLRGIKLNKEKSKSKESDPIVRHADVVALLVALIFVSHPIQTQAVTYIVQRAASMATLFYLATLCLYVQSRLVANKNVGTILYGLSLLMVIVSMFTKETAITIPLMILLYEFCFFKTDKNFNWKYAVPFLFVLLVIPVTMLLTETSAARLELLRREPGISSAHYLFTQFRVIVTYIRLLILPVRQNLDYDYGISQSFFEWPVLMSVALLAVILYGGQRLFSRYRLLAFSVFWFFLTLLPESSFLPIRDVIFEHRLYLPMVGYALFLVGGLYYLVGRKNMPMMIIVLAMIIGINSFLTYQRNKVWKDDFSLWDDTVHKSPHKARPYNNRGRVYFTELGNLTQAFADYSKAVELDPNYADAHDNLGAVYLKQGQYAKALQEYNKTIELDPARAEAYNNRGLIDDKENQLDQAMANFNQAIAINPGLSGPYTNRGLIDEKQGNTTQAIIDYNKAIELEPGNAETYADRGDAYAKEENFDQAILDYTQAIEIDPKMAAVYNNRGFIYAKQNNLTQALSDFNRAIDIDPHYKNAYSNRDFIESKLHPHPKIFITAHSIPIFDTAQKHYQQAMIYAQEGNFDQVIVEFTKAIEIDPKLLEAYYNRGIIYGKQGEFDKAMLDFGKVIEFKPDYPDIYNKRAICYFQLKEYDKALADEQHAENLGAGNPSLLNAIKQSIGQGQSSGDLK